MEIDEFLESFSIVFNKDKTDYHTGETVQGQVRLTLFKPLKVYGVRLHIFGEAWTRWQEGRHTSTSDEKFIDKTITLWGNEDDDGETEKMYPDSYELPFAFVIPISCASSYLCGKSGAIEYSCRAYIATPRQFKAECSKSFQVISPVDLNDDSNNLCRQEKTFSTVLTCRCCVSGEVECTFTIERKAYFPGDSIKISGNLENLSRTTIHKVKAELIKYYTCDAGGHIITKEETLDYFLKESVSAGRAQIWSEETLLIPENTPFSIDNCTIIKLDYKILITVVPRGCCANIEIEFPIIIASFSSADESQD